MVSGHCLVTLSLTINETLIKMALITAHLNAGVILVVTLVAIGIIVSLSPNLHNPFSPSLISRTVSVDVKHMIT